MERSKEKKKKDGGKNEKEHVLSFKALLAVTPGSSNNH